MVIYRYVGYVWLSTVIYGYLCLYMAIYAYVWLYIIIIIIIIIIHNLYSAALLKDPAALYNNGNVNIKSVR